MTIRLGLAGREEAAIVIERDRERELTEGATYIIRLASWAGYHAKASVEAT